MTYQPPVLEKLGELVRTLAISYTGHDKARLAQIELIQTLAKQLMADQNHTALLGLLYLIQDNIALTYYGNPEPGSRFGMFRGGSILYQILQNGLGCKTQKPSEAQKLIYFAALKKHLCKTDTSELSATAKLELNNLSSFIQKNIIQSKPDLDILLKRRPSAYALKKSFTQIPEDYAEYKKNTLGRDKYVEFIKILESACERDHLDQANITLPNESHTLEKRPIGYTARLGLLIYLMQQIEDEYLLTSPENSYLYRLCQQAANIKHSSDIQPFEKLIYLNALCNIIPSLNPAHVTDANWQDKEYREMKSFFLKMEKNVTELMSHEIELINKADAHPTLAKVRGLIQKATLFGINICTANVTSNVMQFNPGKNLVSGSAGLVGFAFYGPQGALVASQIGNLVEQRLIPNTVHNLIGKVLNQVGAIIGHTAGQAVYLTFSIPVDAVNALMGFSQSFSESSRGIEIKPYEDPNWINALLDLPDELFPEAQKKIIRSVEGIEKVAEPKAILLEQPVTSSNYFQI